MSVTWGNSQPTEAAALPPVVLELREQEIPPRSFVDWVCETADYHLFLQQGHTVTA